MTTETGATPSDVLCSIAEPTRLRLLNCLAGAPLFVSDLQAILELPQPTVSRHLTVLRHAGLVHDTPIGAFVLYRLAKDGQVAERVLRAVLDLLVRDDVMRQERQLARERSRARTRVPVTS